MDAEALAKEWVARNIRAGSPHVGYEAAFVAGYRALATPAIAPASGVGNQRAIELAAERLRSRIKTIDRYDVALMRDDLCLLTDRLALLERERATERAAAFRAGEAAALARAAQVAEQYVSQWAREHPEDDEFHFVTPIAGIILQGHLDYSGGTIPHDDDQPEQEIARRILAWLRDGHSHGLHPPSGYPIEIATAIRALIPAPPEPEQTCRCGEYHGGPQYRAPRDA